MWIFVHVLSSRNNNINTPEQINIKNETLILVLNKMFNTNIVHADWQTKQLYGGTIGVINLVTGTAETADGENLPYNVVLKTQKKFNRLGITNSWRREYDLYLSDFSTIFFDSLSLRLPECYHAGISDDEMQIWIEYVDGISGNDLTIEMLECAALELGRFQGRIYKQQPLLLQSNTSLSDLGEIDSMKNDYMQWGPETVEYRYIRSKDCEIPEHLRKMLIDMDNKAETVFENIKKLPVVLCHKDFWVENIFYRDGKIILIDWDCAGWGYMGEDIASLIADDTEYSVEYLDEYYQRFIPAYYKGAAEYMDISTSMIDNNYIWEMMIIKFGYRFIHRYMFTESFDRKNQCINMLQKIYEMKDM